MADAKRRITVVNQSEEFLRLIDVLLEEEGPYQVTTRRMGVASVHDVVRTRPELVILDTAVGDALSDEFLDGLLTEPELRGIPIIITTPAPRQSGVGVREARPNVTLLPKPFSAPALTALIERLLPEP